MKHVLAIVVLFIPHLLVAQIEPQPAVHFATLSDWESVKTTAEKEGKYVLVDFFTTWCKPCRDMDRLVYTQDSIGQFVNDHFLSIKIQLDTTSNDNEQTKHWYAEAHRLQKECQINAYPTVLIFSPDGKPVHKGVGYKSPDRFMIFAQNALNPEKQYFTLLSTYHRGKLSYDKISYLAGLALSVGDKKIASEASNDYIKNYLLKQHDSVIYSVKNLKFMEAFLQGSQDKSFQLFLTQGARIDSAMKIKDYAQSLVDQIIQREEVDILLYKDNQLQTDPNWTRIQQQITAKYGTGCADRQVLWGKIRYSEIEKNWPEYCKNVVLKVEKYGPYSKYSPYDPQQSEEARINWSSWDIFIHSTDSSDLKKALAWSKKNIDKGYPDNDYFKTNQAAYLDTYANILYKLGRTSEATAFEEKASSFCPPGQIKDDINECLNKMKSGEPTWATK